MRAADQESNVQRRHLGEGVLEGEEGGNGAMRFEAVAEKGSNIRLIDFVSLNSRLESNKKKRSTWPPTP